MAKTDKKPKETIVISKRSLYLIIFLIIIAIAVAVAVPAAILLKEQRRRENPNEPRVSGQQIGEDGEFYAILVNRSTRYYPVTDCVTAEDDEEGEYETDCIEAAPVQPEAVTNCVSANGEAVTNCVEDIIREVYGEEEDYQGKIVTDIAEFYDLFGFKDSRYDYKFFRKHKLVSAVVSMDDCGDLERVYLSSEDEADVLNIEYETGCGVCPLESYIYLITVDADEYLDYIDGPEYIETSGERCYTYYEEEKKPVIYLYPTSTTDIDVKLGSPEKLTVSYPKYSDAWRVTANPDGLLVDRTTGRSLYSLYYEADYTVSAGVRDEGFVVKGADSASFLEEKLAQLGLNEREAEEFIIYWLPQLEKNTYNYIYFAPVSEIAENMPLNVSPAPDTVIRINMEFKALDAPIQVKEQQLPETPIRQGFTLVEWGGTIL